MSLLALSQVSFEYLSSPILFEDVSFSIGGGDRVAVVGPNGSGKTTLLRLIAGALTPSHGRVVRRRGLRVATADQEIPPGPRQTVFDFVFSALPRLAGLRTAIRESEERLSDAASAGEYAARIAEYEVSGGYAAEAEVSRTLTGLGRLPLDFDQDVQSLSGGERSRVSLARALSMEADLLILDEPTNHLDLAAREWLETALASRDSACILSSHDRALLKAFANRIVEIERAKITVFECGYEEHRRARAALDRQGWAEYEAFERRKAAVTRAARRRDELAARVAAAPEGVRDGKDHYARKAAKVARTARILRERAGEEQRVEKPWEEQPIGRLSFDAAARSGDIVLSAEKLTKAYGAKVLFRGLSFHVRRGNRVAILGPNGSGKTTLLEILQGITPPDAGAVRFGANVEVAAVGQDAAAADLDHTPLEICGTGTTARTLLACLKLRPDRLNCPLSDLSGGERTKVSLASILSSRANLLLLDEPTNHLEIEAQEALEEALRQYPGTVVVVSHDRRFLEALGPVMPVELTSPAATSLRGRSSR